VIAAGAGRTLDVTSGGLKGFKHDIHIVVMEYAYGTCETSRQLIWASPIFQPAMCLLIKHLGPTFVVQMGNCVQAFTTVKRAKSRPTSSSDSAARMSWR